MSVQTQADECMERGLEHIKQAIDELSKVITTDVWGYNEYNNVYKGKIRDSFMDLVAMRDRLQ